MGDQCVIWSQMSMQSPIRCRDSKIGWSARTKSQISTFVAIWGPLPVPKIYILQIL